MRIDEGISWGFRVINMASFGGSHLPNICFLSFLGEFGFGVVLKIWGFFFFQFLYTYILPPLSSPRGTWYGVVLQLLYFYFCVWG